MVPMLVISSQWGDYAWDRMPTAAAAKHTAGSECQQMASSISMSRRSWRDARQPRVQLKSTSSVRKVMEVLTSELYQIHPLPRRTEETCCPFHPVTLTMHPAYPFLCALKALNQEASGLKASPLRDIQERDVPSLNFRCVFLASPFFPDEIRPFVSTSEI